MARIYPNTVPPFTDSAAEIDLHRALGKALGDDWVVIHSLPWLDDSGLALSSGECDFLVLHPVHGMLAIEAKTGVLTPDPSSGRWRCDNGTIIQDPVRQAERAIHHLERELSDRLPGWRNNRDNRLPFSHAVALPHTRALPPANRLPPHVKPDLFLLEGDLSAHTLERRLCDILARHDRRRGSAVGQRLPDADFEAIVKALLPEFRMVPSLAYRLDGEAVEMARLTAQQAFFLQCCRFAPRLLVQGASGSGKTLLACEEAKRHDADGAAVLFLCYNRPLADHVATRLTDEAPGVMVRTFHELCREVIEAAGLPFAVPAGAAALQTFFDETCPELFMDALPAYGRRFDVILVDEMQDFRPTWWVCVGELLSASGRGLLHLFGDPAQNLYGREAELPFREPTITLPANCRNTRAIADWIETHTGKVAPAGAWCPQGEAPEVVSVADDRAEAEAIRRTLHGLVYEEKIDPARIVILGPHALDHSGLATHRILGPYALVDYHPGRRNVTETLAADGDPNLPPDKTPIRYSTIHKFKGLEADIVLLTGLGANSPHHGDENTLTYVGASRARHRLFVFRRAPSVKPVYGTETEPCSAAAGETGRRGR